MRKIALLLTLFCCGLNLQAGNDIARPIIGGEGTRRWVYDIVTSEKRHTILQQFDDEIFWNEREPVKKDGKTYYELKMKLNYKEVPELNWLYRQENEKVYFYDDEKKKELLLFDFGLKEGDVFRREYENSILEAEVVAVYDTTITENYWNTSYTARAIRLRGKEPETQFHDIWVEGIGSIKTGLYPTWKASSSDVYLLDFNTYGGNGAYILPLAPDVPQCIKMAKITKEHFDPDSYPKEETHYEFVNDTLRVWGIRDYYWDYDVCLIGGDNSIRFYEVEPQIQEEVYKLAKFEIKFPDFKSGEYTIYNGSDGIDTTLVCQGADIPEVCDFEPVLKEGRTWNYIGHDTYTMTDDYYSLQVGGDTVVSDIPCKKILYIQGEKVRLHSLMYEKDGRVYGRSDALGAKDGEWLLYFDFNMKEGETFEWYGETYRVVEKDTLNTYGHKRRRIHFCKEGWEYNKGVFTWIEGIGGKEGGLDMPFMLPFNRYTIYLQSCYDGRDIIYSPKGNEMVNAYRPFVEEGKVWKMGWYKEGVDPTTTAPVRIECQYLQGDTIIDGLQYKRLMISEDENMPARYAGAVREDQRVVLFCPIGSTVPLRLYDFASPAGTGGRYINFFLLIDVLFEVNLGEIFVIDTETYKGCGREVRFSGQQKVTWLQGVGHMGLYSLDTSIMNGGSFRLLSCTMGDEVLYYDSSLMPQESEAKKKKLDFTHVIKAQPRAPRHRARQEGDGTLKGEYSDSEMFVRLNPLMGDYTATLADASGRVVYQKTVLTDNVLALNTTLTAYGPGNYVLTLENDDEAYTATLNIEPNGIEKVQGSKGSSTSEAAKPSAKGSKVQGIYDLQGRRLLKAPEKGMYIQDGKKKTHPQPLP